MLCSVNSKDSVPGSSYSGLTNPLVGIVIAAFLVLGLGFYSGASQAEDISDRVQVDFDAVKGKWTKQTYHATVVVTNTSAVAIQSPLRLIITEFKNQRHLLKNAAGVTGDGYSYIDIDLPGGSLGVGETSAPQSIVFKKMSGKAWKKWKKANKGKLASKEGEEASPGWSELNFPIKFHYLVDGEFPEFMLKISQPDAVPGALRINTGEVGVRLTVSVLTDLDMPVGSVLLQRRNNNGCNNDFDCGCEYYGECGCNFDESCVESLLNDDGINGDLEANDGIFSVTDTIDTDALESGECLSYVASAVSEYNGKVESEELLLCATHLRTELFVSNAREATTIEYEGASVLGDEILVLIEQGASTAAFEKFLETIHGDIVGTQLENGIYQIMFDNVFKPDQYAELVALMEQQANVIGVVPNYVGSYTSIPSDPEFGNQHGLQLVSTNNLDSEVRRYVWDAGAIGTGATVIVLDSGVIEEHPDDIDPLGEFGKDTNDLLGHGTQMAGIIGAATDNQTGIAAMARGVQIRSVRISKTNDITLTNMLDGFKRAKGYAGRNKVVSASFSIKNMLSDGGVCNQINKIIDRGAIVVVSAGNDNRNKETGIVPGNCNSPAFDIFTRPGPVSTVNKTSLIVVGASSCTSGGCNEDSRWEESNKVGSNFGDWVDISAPGVDIPATDIDGGYTTVTGTSPATALVSGAAAILRSCDVGGAISSNDDGTSTLGLSLEDVFNTMNLGATTEVDEWTNRLNLYNSLASINTAPGGIVLSADQIADGTDSSEGLAFAEISFTDDTVCDAHSIDVTGGEDAGSFSIGGDLNNMLVIDDGVLEAESQSSYEVEITVSDFYGESVSETFTIGVIGVID